MLRRSDDGTKVLELSAVTALSADQERFLVLHARHLVVKWIWILGGNILRAVTERGRTASITVHEVAHLVQLELIESLGVAGYRLTDKGKEAAP